MPVPSFNVLDSGRELDRGEGRSAAGPGIRAVTCEVEADREIAAHGEEGATVQNVGGWWFYAPRPLGRAGYSQEGMVSQRGRRPEVADAPGRLADLAFRQVADSIKAGRDGARARPGVPEPIIGDDDPPTAQQIGRLKGFVGYLVENGVLGSDSLDSFIDRHTLQKYVYVAQELGMDMGYQFDFLKNGAFSADLEIDIHELGSSGIPAERFSPADHTSRAFLGMVRGRDPEWLQAATFALRDRRMAGAHEAFINDKYRHLAYDGRLVQSAFGAVRSYMSTGAARNEGR